MAGLRAAAVDAVKATAALADRARRPPPGVVILIYHRVGARTDMAVDLPTALFEEQMAWLAARRCAVTLEQALASLAAPALSGGEGGEGGEFVETGRHRVVVTFDDGTADLAEVALPILVRHGLPAVFYLATDFIERSLPFPHDGVPLSWGAVRDSVSTGLITLGSHTATHALLDRVEPATAVAELDRSRALIEERVGVPAADFAYPKAVLASGPVEAMVRERFRSAALGGSRPNRYGRTDRHRLARSAIQRADGMRYFAHKASGGMALEDSLRRVLNRGRYSGAVS